MNKIELIQTRRREAEMFTNASLNHCKFRTFQFHRDICR